MRHPTLAAVLLVGVAGTAHAQRIQPLDAWERQVQHRLYAQRVRWGLEHLTHALVTGTLREGETEVLRLELEPATPYTVLGVCDGDCTDLDLEVFDAAGAPLGSDLLVNDHPVVRVEPAEDRRYRLRVSMAACAVEPCRYAVAVFSP